MQKRSPSLMILTAATLLASTLAAAPAFAATVATAGGPLLRIDTRGSIDEVTTSSTSFANLPGAQVRIVIPTTGGSRLVVARFSAESNCAGSVPQACLMRIIAVNADTSVITEMLPQAGLDFKFDSASTDQRESLSFDRSLRLTPATYFIRAQWAVQIGTQVFTLDDWHFTVAQYD